MPETLSGAREIKGKESLFLNVFGRWGGGHETEIRDKNQALEGTEERHQAHTEGWHRR